MKSLTWTSTDFEQVLEKDKCYCNSGYSCLCNRVLAACVTPICQFLHHNVGDFLLGWGSHRTRCGVLFPPRCGAARHNMCCCSRRIVFTGVWYHKQIYLQNTCCRFRHFCPTYRNFQICPREGEHSAGVTNIIFYWHHVFVYTYCINTFAQGNRMQDSTSLSPSWPISDSSENVNLMFTLEAEFCQLNVMRWNRKLFFSLGVRFLGHIVWNCWAGPVACKRKKRIFTDTKICDLELNRSHSQGTIFVGILFQKTGPACLKVN